MVWYLRVMVMVSVCLSAGCMGPHARLKPPVGSRIGDADFRQAMGHLTGGPFVPGNRVGTLVDGDEIFPAMLQGIRSARRTITFETYVFEKGEVPRQFAEALSERASAGVKVHVILDAYGSSKSDPYHAMMRQAGVELRLYRPFLRHFINRYNNRTHRKLLVIDGRVAFTGGVGIGDRWRGRAQSPKHWHDLHYRIEGPAVAQLQAAFVENWMEIGSDALIGPDYFPSLAHSGGLSAGFFTSSPDRHSRKSQLMFNLAIASSQRSLLIQTPYFLPDQPTINMLIDAAKRGVRVQLIVPGDHMDKKAIRRSARRHYGLLTNAGVEVYEYEPTMTHAKLLVADGLFVSVGSSNVDSRSLHLNDEANLNVLEASFAAEQTRLFNRDLARSRRWRPEDRGAEVVPDALLQAAQLPLEGQM